MSEVETPLTPPPATMQVYWDPFLNLHFAAHITSALPQRNAREDLVYSPYSGLPIHVSDNLTEPVIAVVVTPPAPTALVATPGVNSVGLAWTAVPSGVGAAASYQIFRGTVSGAESGTPLATVYGGAVTYTDSTAVDATEYFYTVKAVNVAGTSAASNEANATPT